jgi:putative nucleotidyltransferase with HDIG domain
VSRSWIVGGALRDELLGREVTDIDIAVEGDPESAARERAAEVRGPVFRLSEAFGAWRVVDRGGGLVYDFAPLQGATIEEDLRKRDFTVNAMARQLAAEGAPSGELIDPLGGRSDIESRTLRVIGPEAYESDPLRPLRLARFAAELGFEPDGETERLTAAAAPRVPEASGERIFAELRRLVLAPGAMRGLALADRLGLVHAVLPELAELHDVEQSHFHHKDVYGHTLEVLERLIQLEGEVEGELREVLDEPLADELTRGQALRFGALLHDIGKPATHDVREDGRVTFMGHDRLGEQMVRQVCRRLRTSDRLSRFLEGITRHHLVLGFLVHERPLDRRAIYRYLRRTSPVEVEITLFSCADRLATRGKNADHAIDAHMELAKELMPAALEWRRQGPPRLPLRGNELAEELGIEPGPELGRLLAGLEEAAYAGEVRSREEAVETARRLRQNAGR